MVGRKLSILTGVLLFLAIASAQFVPYFPVTMFPENPKDGDVVEVYVSNYDDLAGSARFVWIKDGVIYRNVTKPFTVTSISDSLTVFPGSWNVTVYVYDRSDPPNLINFSSIGFEVSGTALTRTPTPTPEPTPTSTAQPTTPAGSQTLTPTSGDGGAGGGTGGGSSLPVTPEFTATPVTETTNATPSESRAGEETAVNESPLHSFNVTKTPPSTETPGQTSNNSGTENVSKTPEAEKVPQTDKTDEKIGKEVKTPAFTLLAALLSVLVAVWFRAIR